MVACMQCSTYTCTQREHVFIYAQYTYIAYIHMHAQYTNYTYTQESTYIFIRTLYKKNLYAHYTTGTCTPYKPF